jgi:hypothetical protein
LPDFDSQHSQTSLDELTRLGRKVMFVKKDIVGLSLVLIVVGLAAAQEHVSHAGGVSGVVRYPDGSPSSHATVWASTNCKDTDVHIALLKEVKTASDGSFYVPPFLSAHCNHILLRAGKPEDFWLRTGREIFYESDNGTTREVDVPRTGNPILTEIRLGRQGGFVSVRVRDVKSDRFIWAELRLEHVPELEFPNLMDIATNSPPVLLPAAQYKVFLESYSCGGKNYFTDGGVPVEPLTVEAGEKVTKDFSIDVRAIKPVRSSQNPEGRPCEP